MRPNATAILFASMVAGVSSAAAQARPDFTGVWVRAAEPAPTVATTGDAGFRTGDMGSGWGTPLTLTHRGDSLIVEYVFFGSYDLQPPIRLAHAADGSESTNRLMIGHATVTQRSRIAWRDSTLAITTLHSMPREVAASGTVEVVHTLTLATPTSLLVETTRAGAGGAPVKTRTTYTKR